MLFRNAHTHTHSQDNDCGDECTPVQGSSAAVSGGRLLLVHLPATVATAAAARQEETNQGHQDNVQDADGHTHQETHLVDQDLSTKHTQRHRYKQMISINFDAKLAEQRHVFAVCRDVKQRETSPNSRFTLLWWHCATRADQRVSVSSVEWG